MVDGLRRFFKEEPEAPVTRVVFAVPEPDKYELARRRLDELLVLRREPRQPPEERGGGTS
jgi:hypothetical protein